MRSSDAVSPKIFPGVLQIDDQDILAHAHLQPIEEALEIALATFEQRQMPRV